MRLCLTLGSNLPAPEATEFGFEGPELFGVASINFIGLDEITVRFHDVQSRRHAQRETRWSEFDEVTLLVEPVNSFIPTNEPKRSGAPAYYSRWALIDDFSYNAKIREEIYLMESSLRRLADYIP